MSDTNRKQKNPQVLIVGAGPTGLMAACQLAMRGIHFRIIDKQSGPTTQSRALVIQARSLEILAQMGLSKEALSQGQSLRALNLLINGKEKAHIDVEKIGKTSTSFPDVLVLEQSKTERLLLKFLKALGYGVEWNTELLSLNQDENEVCAILKTSHDQQQKISVPWLIGADSAHSIVRHNLEIGFGGGTYKQSLFVLDCDLAKGDLRHHELYLCLAENDFGLLVPMRGKRRIRIIGFLPHDLHGKEITFNDVYPSFAKRLKLNIKLENPHWISAYHSHHRYAKVFRKGHCFLAGDSAHIHSPAGAQGMNTGLQDAYNLSWKLALVIKNQADQKILDTYHLERIGVAKKLVQTTDRVFSFVSSSNSLTKYIRLHFFPKIFSSLFKHKTFLNFFFQTISEIGISYRKSPLSRQTESNFNPKSPLPGDRVPHGQIGRTPIENLLKNPKFQLLIFSNKKYSTKICRQIKKHSLDRIINIHVIPPNPSAKSIYQIFGIKKHGLYLIRPDQYIAYRSASFDSKNLFNYLKSINIYTSKP